ncbi:MAG: hypothetical protein ABJC09_03335 [Terriglobia bacterium]
MDRRLLFPLVAVTASAQQPSPEAAAAEAALRARVDQFYKLQMDKKYRQAEAFVAEDTKDLYFAGRKPELLGFSILKVELMDGFVRAKVTIKAKSSMLVMGAGRLPFEVPTDTLWKIEDGKWMWYVDTQAALQTPFGDVKRAGVSPSAALEDFANLAKGPDLDAVKIDRTAVTLAGAEANATAVISNGMPGFVDLSVQNSISGLKVEIDQPHIPANGKATLRFSKAGDAKIDGVVRVTVSPLNTVFDIRVR